MADDLISREAAIKLLRGECIGKYPSSFRYGLFAAADELRKMPAVEAVPAEKCNNLIGREAAIKKVSAFASTVIYRGCEEMLSAKDSCNPAEWTRGYEKGVTDTATMFLRHFNIGVQP